MLLASRRPVHHRRAVPRWIVVALSALLAIGLLGRGHLLQAVGVSLIACGHPGEEVQHAEHGSADDSGDHCPATCHRCPCGQMPMTAPAPEAVVVSVLEYQEIEVSPPPSTPGRAVQRRLDRPPRRSPA